MRAFALSTVAGVAVAASAASAQVTLNAFMTADNAFQASVSTDAAAAGPVNFLTGNNWAATFSGSTQFNAAGTYFLQILAQDFGPPASFVADLTLAAQPGWSATFSNGGTSLLSNTTDWVVSNQGFGVNAITPNPLGNNGVSPWGTRPNISPNALNIWHSSGSTTVYFTTVITVVPTPGVAALLGLGGLVATRRRR